MTLVITSVELPVGTYSIEEDTSWSWRYPNPVYGADVTLTKDHTSDTIACSNKKDALYWLNGFSEVVANIFGQAKK